MYTKYYTADIVPLLPASKQHVGVFTAGDVLFDWTEVLVPKGTSRIIGAAMQVRPKGNAAVAANNFGAFLVFSKTNTQSLGIVNSSPFTVPTNDLLGFLELEDATSYPNSTLKSTTIGLAGRSSKDVGQQAFLINPSENVNAGFDRVYVAAIANGAFFFGASLNAIAEDTAADAAASKVITMDGTGMNVQQHFIPGDILHTGTTVGETPIDTLIGTVESVAEDELTMTAVSPALLVDGDILYNINPIRISLFFEK
tara:strand:- start:42 stop:806 length:765 start_codon:yes stop_codon:yes gene_type:complete